MEQVCARRHVRLVVCLPFFAANLPARPDLDKGRPRNSLGEPSDRFCLLILEKGTIL